MEERWVTVDGHRMRYLRAGAGPPLLLIHGLLGYSFSWRYNLEALAQVAEVYAPDLIGTGFSDRPTGLDCGMGASAERLRRFMDAVGMEAADVLGSSHGGSLAVLLAGRSGAAGRSRVRRLILVSPANPWSRRRMWAVRLLAHPAAASLFRKLEPHLRFLGPWFLGRMYGDRKRIRPGTLQGYLRSYLQPGTLDYALGIVACWRRDMQELEQALPWLAGTPTLLIWGERDRVVAPSSAKPLQQRLPASRLAVIAGAGHLPYEEFPEEFNRLVIGFLGETAGAPNPALSAP